MHGGYSDSLIVTSDVIGSAHAHNPHALLSRILWWPTLADLARYPLHHDRSFFAAAAQEGMAIHAGTVELHRPKWVYPDERAACASDSALGDDLSGDTECCGDHHDTRPAQSNASTATSSIPTQVRRSRVGSQDDEQQPTNAQDGVSVGLSRLGQSLFCSARLVMQDDDDAGEGRTGCGMTSVVVYNPFSGADIMLRVRGAVPADARAVDGLRRLALAGRIRVCVDASVCTSLPVPRHDTRSHFCAARRNTQLPRLRREEEPPHQDDDDDDDGEAQHIQRHRDEAIQGIYDFLQRSCFTEASKRNRTHNPPQTKRHNFIPSRASRCFGTIISGPPGSTTSAVGRAVLRAMPCSMIVTPRGEAHDAAPPIRTPPSSSTGATLMSSWAAGLPLAEPPPPPPSQSRNAWPTGVRCLCEVRRLDMAELLTYDEREALTVLDCALRPPPTTATTTTTATMTRSHEFNVCVLVVLLLENMDLLGAGSSVSPTHPGGESASDGRPGGSSGSFVSSSPLISTLVSHHLCARIDAYYAAAASDSAVCGPPVFAWLLSTAHVVHPVFSSALKRRVCHESIGTTAWPAALPTVANAHPPWTSNAPLVAPTNGVPHRGDMSHRHSSRYGNDTNRAMSAYDGLFGLDDAIDTLEQLVVWPLTHREVCGELRVGCPRGVLVCGPCGSGKTALLCALANRLTMHCHQHRHDSDPRRRAFGDANASGAPCPADALTCTSPPSRLAHSPLRVRVVDALTLLSKEVGQSERNIAHLFATARACAPTVLFVDNLDALAPPRGRSCGESSMVTDRTLSTLLTEMDGIVSEDRVRRRSQRRRNGTSNHRQGDGTLRGCDDGTNTTTSTHTTNEGCRTHRDNDSRVGGDAHRIVVVIAAAPSCAALDEAVCRAGRLDVHIQLHPVRPEEAATAVATRVADFVAHRCDPPTCCRRDSDHTGPIAHAVGTMAAATSASRIDMVNNGHPASIRTEDDRHTNAAAAEDAVGATSPDKNHHPGRSHGLPNGWYTAVQRGMLQYFAHKSSTANRVHLSAASLVAAVRDVLLSLLPITASSSTSSTCHGGGEAAESEWNAASLRDPGRVVQLLRSVLDRA